MLSNFWWREEGIIGSPTRETELLYQVRSESKLDDRGSCHGPCILYELFVRDYPTNSVTPFVFFDVKSLSDPKESVKSGPLLTGKDDGEWE